MIDRETVYNELENKHRLENEKISNSSLSTRLFVIESTIYIEELISGVLGFLLDFDWNKSKSLGATSSSLSFNNKVTLMKDICGVNNEISNKMSCLMQIRNKFAHVNDIDNFQNLIQKSSNGLEIKNQLKKWYSKDLDRKDIEENEYRAFFNDLREDIIKFSFKIIGDKFYDIAYEEGKEKGKMDFSEKFKNKLIKELLKQKGGKDTILRFMAEANEIE